MIRLSNFLSYLLHPVFMPVFGIFIILNSGIYPVEIHSAETRFIYVIVILTNSILPLSFLPALIYFKNISTFQMNERRERLLPLAFTMVCFYLSYHIIARFSSVRVVNVFLLSTVVSVLILSLISVFWKISLHMAGIGGIVGTVVMLSLTFATDFTFLLCVCILLSGIIGSARLAVSDHSPLQLIFGFISGFGSSFLLMSTFA